MENDYIYGQQMNNFNNNMIDDDMNNYDDCVQYDECSPYDPCNPFGEDNCIENEYINDNQMFLNNKENIELKKQIKELNQKLFEKNKELEENRRKNDDQLIKINKTFDNHINEYQRLVNNYSNLKNELNIAKNEIKNKNQIIFNLQNNRNANNINSDDQNLILFINQKLKNMFLEFFEEENNENENENKNIFNEDEYLNLDTNNQLQLLIKNIDIFSNELNEYKNNNYNEIIQLRNLLQSNNNNNTKNNGNNNNVQQFYLKYINLMNNFINSLSNNIGTFPNYSLEDDNNKKYNDILLTSRILTDYIISTQNTNNNIPTNENNMNMYNEELNKRLKEMSELLVKSNEYLNKSRQDYNELKQKYNELEKKYNLNIKDISSIDNNNNNNNKDNDYSKLVNELNNKNQQIKSLEHMIARLTNRTNNNNNTSNFISKSMLNDTSYCGKIVNKKIYNEIKNNTNQSSLYFNNNKFVRDEKNENNLRLFLNKYTNGEYDRKIKDNENNNDANIINIKDEIENLNKGLSNEIDDDDIENNYNEEEEERKYLMEGKINNDN